MREAFFQSQQERKDDEAEKKAGMTLDFSLFQCYLMEIPKNDFWRPFAPEDSPTGKIANRDNLIVFYYGGIHA